jgi:hypothetical protein
MYDFYRTAVPSADPLTVKAKSLKLHSFVSLLIDEYPQLISNAQVNLIANKGGRIPREQDLPRAIRRVREAAVVGVVEQFDMCCLTAEHSLRVFFPNLDLTYVPENVSAGRCGSLHERKLFFEKACGAQLYMNVVNLNTLDYQLVEITSREAVARFERLPAKHGSIAEFRQRREVRLRQKHNGLQHAHPGQFFNYLLHRRPAY